MSSNAVAIVSIAGLPYFERWGEKAVNQVLSCRLSYLASLAKGWAVKLYNVCVGVVLKS